MSFLDDIKAVKATEDAKRQVVIDEICEFFQKQLDDGSFEEWLKKRIIERIKENKNYTEVQIEFWQYTAGCSGTHFRIDGCKRFETEYGYDGNNFKGIELHTIAPAVVERLAKMLDTKLDGLCLIHTVCNNTKEYRLGYPKRLFTIYF